MDEKTTARRVLATSIKDNKNQSDSTNIDRDQSDQQVRVSRCNASTEYHKPTCIAKRSLKDILVVYSKWKPLFYEVEGEQALLKHQP